MTCSKLFRSVAFVAAFSLIVASPAHAQRRGGGGSHGGGVRGDGHVGGGIVGRPGIGGGRPIVVSPRIISPRIVGYGYYRPYYYYRPGISIGFYAGFDYPYYYPYAYPYSYAYPYAYPYSYSYPYSYPYYSYPAYGYSYPGYSYPGYGYSQYPQQPYAQQSYPPQNTATARQNAPYGGVRIEGAPHDAQVYVDGYYAGIVDDFEGANKHLNLTSGVHQVEIRITGQQPVAFDVNVPPNQTITVRVP